MTRASSVTLDTSIWVPYLRWRRYADTVDDLVARGHLWLHSVVLLELYAGTMNHDDKRDVDEIRAAAREQERLLEPTEADFCLAGQILSYHSRRHGALRPRDHAHDLLIAIGAARAPSLLLTENLSHMRRWARALQRRAGVTLKVACPET